MTGKRLADSQQIEIIAQNEKLVVSSLDVARHFDKRHGNVLRAIKRIEAEEPSFTQLNFEFSEYMDSTGRPLPMVEMTRSGFSILAMGFTGKKALEWKIKYEQAFAAMEQALKQEQQWMTGLIEGLHRICPPPAVEDNSVRRWRAIKILRGVTAYWATLDGLSQEIAEKTVCAVGNINGLDSYQVEDGTYNNMLLFLFRSIARSKDDDVAATGQQIMTIKHLAEACIQFKYSRKMNIYDHLQEIYGITAEQILTATESEAKRIAATVYAIIFQQIQTCEILGEFNDAAKNLMERNQRQAGPGTTDLQGGKP
ncbi:MAG: Rha family transcriptional regulator [Desulfobulbus sp.]|jgi:Rha family phage regulatory protein|uniref:Rha family transcriptional regulator n=1 Tax=Desulfobulbus sp. TaxID=895 RepID=UPI00284748A4|nr:Rha family transcriptional regulator [Desulfobulbus sp.]MDR2549108.1 Rha family transcriptional regulator [Desulfobulbus sp.]